jgi:hypothetical protein
VGVACFMSFASAANPNQLHAFKVEFASVGNVVQPARVPRWNVLPTNWYRQLPKSGQAIVPTNTWRGVRTGGIPRQFLSRINGALYTVIANVAITASFCDNSNYGST